MIPLLVHAYTNLIYFDILLSNRTFNCLYEKIRRHPTSRYISPVTVECVCSAVDHACIWYWKEVLCLQRSAATACLLRRHGVNAHLVIGAQQSPFKAHAWVEVNGRIVNDKPYMQEIYAVLDRC